MSITVAQSFLSSTTTTTITTAGGNATATASYPSNPANGSLLLALVWIFDTLISGAFGISSSLSETVTDPLNTWTGFNQAQFTPAGGGSRLTGRLFALGNNSNVNSGTVITATATTGASSSSLSQQIQILLYEIQGIVQNSNLAGAGPVVDNVTAASGTGTTPAANLTTTVAGDMLFSHFVGTSGLLSAGSGFTLGANCANMTAQNQYLVGSGASLGSNAVGFSGGTEAHWALQSISFKAAAGHGFSGTSVNYGYLFG